MSLVDTRVFCDACGERLVGFEEWSHKRRCRGYSHAQVNSMTDADKSVLVGLIYMAWAIQQHHAALFTPQAATNAESKDR